MPQSVLVQVGQCGNQIGFNFWTSLLQEYRYHRNNLTEEQFSQFLRPISKAKSPWSLEENYKARAILIDMEEGVLNVGRRSSIGSLFPKKQILTDNSGSGNNWAVGNLSYGKKYRDSLKELFRIQAEACDILDAFLFVFSLSGGTGSGLGTAALEMLADCYPKTKRVVFTIFPSDANDVITSPYNAVLSNAKLVEHAHLVVPFDNQVMEDICKRLESNKFIRMKMKSSSKASPGSRIPKAYEKENEYIVSTMLDCTSSSRYSSSPSLCNLLSNLSVDKKKIYALPSIAPLFASDDSSVERLFNNVSSDNNVLFDCGSKRKVYYGATFFARGKQFCSTAVYMNINKLCDKMKWGGPIAVRQGHCNYSPANKNASIAMLSNSSAVTHCLTKMVEKLDKMYKKKAHLHHYEKVDSEIGDVIDAASSDIKQVIESYKNHENLPGLPCNKFPL